LAELKSDKERVIKAGEGSATPKEGRESSGGAFRNERELEGECPGLTAPNGGLLGGLGLEELPTRP